MKPEPHVVSELEKRLDVAHHLPSLRRLGLGVAALALVALFVWPISAATRRTGLSGGAVSNHHRLIEPACDRCHSSAFRPVTDAQCASCHTVKQHAAAVPAVVAAHPTLGARCADCHKEHHGEGSLVPNDSPLCTGCHARLDRLVPASAQPGVGDFAHHPEFAVRAWSGDPPAFQKVRLDQPNLRDGTQLKFSHDEHLGQVGADGKPALACASCHERGDDDERLRPVSYARHCERCHHIEFDDRLKGRFVPHGDPAGVIGFVTAEVSRLHVERLRSAGAKQRELVERESRDDEIGLFTHGGACFKCHDVEELPSPKDPRQGHFRVLPPNVPAKWMPASVFGHGAHRQIACESCHAGVRESTSASDILLPRIARCRECHADPGTPAKVDSPCLQCHAYHP